MRYQTAVANRTSCVFFRAPKIGSPNRNPTKSCPEKMLHMHETQQEKGCRREKGMLPVEEKTRIR